MTNPKEKEWLDNFNRLYVARDGTWLDSGANPLNVKEFLRRELDAAYNLGMEDEAVACQKGELEGYKAGQRDLLEKVKEKIGILRSEIIKRTGPNDTDATRLAELSLFAEILTSLEELTKTTEHE